MLFVNGEIDNAEIYAVDKTNGDILATLQTSFGSSHVVGGAYSQQRDSFFLVQDSVPDTVNDNLIAEVDAQTGGILNLFDVDVNGFTVFFGDIDVSSVTGNLFIVSSTQSSIAEFLPTGSPVREHPLPTGVSGLAGIGISDRAGQAWVLGSSGLSLLGGLYEVCDFDSDGDCDVADLDLMLAEGPIANGVGTTDGANDQFDLTDDGTIDLDDVDAWLANAASENGFGSPYRFGDANLDGSVDVSDFNVWNESKLSSTLRWSQGDFNGDGVNDTSDFNFWNDNKFLASDAPVSVPEPSGTLMFLLAFSFFAVRLNRAASR